MATLKDIARIANVSTTTVSRVLSGDHSLSIPEDTRERIMSATKQTKYRVRPKKKEIGKNSVKRIGVLTCKSEQQELTDPYFLSIRRGVEQECHALGFSEFVMHECSADDTSCSTFEGVDGLVVIGDNPYIEELLQDSEAGRRVVFVDTCPEPSLFNSVMVDYTRATYQALEHLLNLGYRTIGHLSAFNQFKIPDPRLVAFRSCLGERGLLVEGHIHIGDAWSSQDGYLLARKCIDNGAIADAYFIASDPLAIGAIRAFIEAGFRVPEDVAIVSFDNIDVTAFMTPAITTINVPTETMGRIAVDLLVDGVGKHSIPLQIVVPTELVIRESCGFWQRSHESEE